MDRQTKWAYKEIVGRDVQAKKGRKRKNKETHEKMYIFSVSDIKQSYCAGAGSETQSQTAARGWTISLVPLSRAREESKLQASLLAELIQQANDIQTSLLRPWTGPSIVCVWEI